MNYESCHCRRVHKYIIEGKKVWVLCCQPTSPCLWLISEQLKDASAVEHLLLSVYVSLGHNFSLRTGKINLLVGLSASLSEIRFAENRRECKCWLVMSKPGMDDHTELLCCPMVTSLPDNETIQSVWLIHLPVAEEEIMGHTLRGIWNNVEQRF